MKNKELCKIMARVTDVGSDDCYNVYESIFSDGCKGNSASNDKGDED